MAFEFKKNSGKASLRRGQRMPVKRSINLAGVGENKINLWVTIPSIVLIVLIAALFSKFAVIDRLMAVEAARQEVARVQSQLEKGYREIDSYDDLVEKYAHYTYSGMTKEELTRPDRMAVMDLIRRVVLPRADLKSWQLTGSQLTLNINAGTLEEINAVKEKLEAEDMVNYCTVTTAATETTKERLDGSTEVEILYVTGRVIAFLNDAEEVNAG
ncbi:MAG: hypothetical protein K6G17_08355 [Oscillospiraceae bacterium]|nr:hypothetical protein [Oscillospiraceae bacterium]